MEHSGAKSIITIPALVHKVEEAGIKVHNGLKVPSYNTQVVEKLYKKT